MTYGEMQEYQKDRLFQTSDGEMDARNIRDITGIRIEFDSTNHMTLRRVNVPDLERALLSVINHYAEMLKTVVAYESGKGNE